MSEADPGPIPREELEATVGARKDLTAEHEAELVEGFLERVGGQVDARVDQRLAEQKRKDDGPAMGMGVVLGSVALGIPVTGVAGSQAELPGVVVAWAGIVIVNILYWRARR